MRGTRRSRTRSTGSSACRGGTRCCGSSSASIRRCPTRRTLSARRPDGTVEAWGSSPELALSQQLGQCLAQWLSARRLPQVGALSDFTLEDVRVAADRLLQAERQIAQGSELDERDPRDDAVPRGSACRSCACSPSSSRDEARSLDPVILKLDPTHPVARRNRYVTGLLAGEVDRRAILPLVDEAPMYAKPHLSIWGEPFAAERPLENMGVRHQGIAASLMPANPYACHNYSLQLAEAGRREESYRWADRATVAAPQFGAAHLDCVRRLRQVGRPGQAFAEAQYRCRELLDRAGAGTLASERLAGAAPRRAPDRVRAPRHRADRRGDRARRRRDEPPARRRADAGELRVGAEADRALEDRRRPARPRVRVGGPPPRRSRARDRRPHARPDHRRR